MKVYLRGLLTVGTVFILFVALGDDVVGRPPETGRWAWAKWCLEWWYLITSLVLGIIGWLKRKNLICCWWAAHDLCVTYTIEDLEKRHLSVDHLMATLRAKIPVAIIDDNSTASRGMRDLLTKTLDYKNVSEIYPPEFSNKQMGEMLIFIVDIKGVAFSNQEGTLSKHEGLDVAKALKKHFPLARVISYSADIDAFKGCDILNDVIDGRFEKRDTVETKLREIDKGAKQLFDPVLFWKWYRPMLSEEKLPTREIAKMENKFVRSLIHVGELNLQIISEALGCLEDSKRIAKSLARLVRAWEGVVAK